MFAVIASPIDNSPNTVLECLSYKIKFIASNVGGIPELVHPDDRPNVLFEPNPKDLARLLRGFLVLQNPLAPVTAAVSNEVRQKLWVDLHTTLIPELFASQPQVWTRRLGHPITYLTLMQFNVDSLVTIIVRLWCSSNLETLLNSIATQSYNNVEVILGVSEDCLTSTVHTVEAARLTHAKVVQVPQKFPDDLT